MHVCPPLLRAPPLIFPARPERDPRNHSCDPNCSAWHVSIGGSQRTGTCTTSQVNTGKSSTGITARQTAQVGRSVFAARAVSGVAVMPVQEDDSSCACGAENCHLSIITRHLVDSNFDNSQLDALARACGCPRDAAGRTEAVLAAVGFGTTLCRGSRLWLGLFCAAMIETSARHKNVAVSIGRSMQRVGARASKNCANDVAVEEEAVTRLRNLAIMVDGVVASLCRRRTLEDVAPLLRFTILVRKN